MIGNGKLQKKSRGVARFKKIHLVTAVLIVLVVLCYSPNKRSPLTASANDFEEESIFSNRAKTLLYLQYGKAPSNIDFIGFANKGVNHRHRKSRPGIPRDSPKDFALFLRFFLSHFFASWCYSNTGKLTRFRIEYELSVGSKCNSLKTNLVFKNELGCLRAIHYLTPPPLAIFWGDVHV